MILHRSLTLRLTVLFAIAATAVLVVIGYLFAMSLDVHFQHEDAMELRGKTELVRHLLSRLHSDGDIDLLDERLKDALIGHETLFVSLREPSGRLIFASPAELYTIDQLATTAGMHEEDGVPITARRIGAHHYRIASTVQTTDVPSLPQVRITVAMNIDHHQEFIDSVRRSLWFAVAMGAGLSGFLAWLAARLGLAPVRALAELTTKISANRLNTRVAAHRLPPELSKLGSAFNAMLSRLEESFRRLNDFSSDLAHELRTPISNLQTQAQVAISRGRSAEEYREVLYSALEEYDRLARMIGDMLFLAKADNGQLIPEHENVDLRAETEALFEFYDALVEAQNVRLSVQGNGTVRGDRIMLRRALSNVLSNAIRHCAADGTVNVAIITRGKDTIVTVSNPGPPIPSEHLPRIFDRFYRVDPARQRSTEGAGLGLAITRTIVTAHGGTIGAASDVESTRFELRLPNGKDKVHTIAASMSSMQ